MTNDDELRSRIGRMADARSVSPLTVDTIQARSARRGRRRTALAAVAAVTLLVGLAGVVRVVTDDGGSEIDVAGDPESSEEDDAAEAPGDDQEGGEAGPTTTTTVVASASEDVAAASFGFGGCCGPDWVVPWGDGFLSLGSVLDPSDATMQDLVPDIADRLPPAVIESLEEAGLTGIDESIAHLTEVGLIDEATAAVTADPVLMEAFNQVNAGGTYRFEASVSPDGVDWSVLEGFALPGGSESASRVLSDGTHLVVAAERYDEGEGGVREISVSSTTDLENWSTATIPVAPVTPSADHVNVEHYLNAVALGPDGWFVSLSRNEWIDVWSLFPEHVRMEMEDAGYGWSPAPEGIRIESYPDGSYGDAEPNGEVPPAEFEALEPEVVRTVPWSDLGVSYEEFESFQNTESISAGAWVGGWDGRLEPATEPAPGNFQVTGTDAGFLAQGWGGFDEVSGQESTVLYFSADGQSWTPVEAPGPNGWVNSLVSVDGGVLVSYSDGGPNQVWRSQPDGSDWQPVDLGDLPTTNIWFNDTGSRGSATVVDASVYEDSTGGLFDNPPYSITLEEGGFEITITSEDMTWRVQIRAVGADDSVLDAAFDQRAVAQPEFLRMVDGAVEFLADDGTAIVAIPEEQLNSAVQEAMDASRQELGITEPQYDYQPDFWLVATTDGINWLVEDLDEPEVEFYGQAAVNGTTVVVRHPDSWITFSTS